MLPTGQASKKEAPDALHSAEVIFAQTGREPSYPTEDARQLGPNGPTLRIARDSQDFGS